MSSNLLARIDLLSDLPEEELDRILAKLDVVNLKSGEILFREGDLGEDRRRCLAVTSCCWNHPLSDDAICSAPG